MVGGGVTATAPWWAAGSVVALWMLRETWTAFLSRRKERTETDANVDLIKGLSERIGFLEQRVTAQDERLQAEMEMRLKAQEDASALRIRVQQLESMLRGLGAVIPPENPVVSA
ncbi:hypothetical protein FJU31_04065 [Stenotrophomonas cyclobalanopsidis]|uniref:DUF2730 family protein n=1 Tax=Stenotrophomonas cyclobalanopsidis TaxID=2771362 RepID=A0ABQ6T4L7_9GAMM|nr:hypothetical protein [Stenotrophomonas cyclobalanopsidis]KAA9003486.1 hypothetical protein FJU31_04065 [Stenotrophomonas cyclobalanopsidis]